MLRIRLFIFSTACIYNECFKYIFEIKKRIQLTENAWNEFLTVGIIHCCIKPVRRFISIMISTILRIKNLKKLKTFENQNLESYNKSK